MEWLGEQSRVAGLSGDSSLKDDWGEGSTWPVLLAIYQSSTTRDSVLPLLLPPFSPRRHQRPISQINNSLQQKSDTGTSLVVQWLRICLPVQGTWVWSLVWEDPTCNEASKFAHHNSWACALEPKSCKYLSPQASKPVLPRAYAQNKRSHHNENPIHATREAPRLSL